MSSISIEYQRLKSLFTNVDESKSELVDELSSTLVNNDFNL